MNKQTEALKMAIELLEDKDVYPDEHIPNCFYEVLQACKETLEQPARLVSYAPDKSTCTLNIDGEEVYFNREQPEQENKASSLQEPVAWTDLEGNFSSVGTAFFHPFPLYTHPASSWQGLSDEEITKVIEACEDKLGRHLIGGIMIARAIEQALKEKNT